ncbi:DUF2785 domain-containing protein [Dictyobacter formicarum]|uniref:DUF2785 domain-containing protein n=1 Tax=Dictyobacter formicarum TaxID=2778368 RepID=A0ABQ3VLP6_9CHLR|nr:DUF2785 domain-containing protein [Dictyobacter formicarum]GHO86629.1 hypothetical protein KSZ_46350 [Dictyobacter formicarum]
MWQAGRSKLYLPATYCQQKIVRPESHRTDPQISSIILAAGIIGQQKLTQKQLEELLSVTLDQDHLFYQVGETGTDSVFMRSFSCLIIASILFNDSPDPHLSSSTITLVKEKLSHYAQEEKDWRGYVEGKGWAHAMAHLADALDECAQHPHMSNKDRQEILVLVSELATLDEPLYHEEDLRLAKIAYHIILGHQVDDNFISKWIEMCSISRDLDVESWMRIINAKNVLRSLYFLLHWDNMAPLVTERISEILYKQDEVYLEAKKTTAED